MKDYLPTRFDMPIRFICIALLSTFLFSGCGDSDDITANSSSFSFIQLNTCDIGSGDLATRFNFRVNYDAALDVQISKVLFDIEWSSGDSDSAETSSIDDLATSVEYSWCYRFGSEDWVEITHRLVTSNGTESNESVVRIDKPDGAN